MTDLCPFYRYKKESLRFALDTLDKLLVGHSEAVRDLRFQIQQVASTDATVLVWGESGTGKELVALGIHSCSPRKPKHFVPLNCGAIPKDLFESELFGHEKGAFSGAVTTRTGRFELANEGTLFLDEIGEMPLDMQVKMLRALQEKKVERVGGGLSISVDTRIVAATNRCLETAVDKGEFREDLFYRLNVYPIYVPPLRERGEDVIELFNYFAERLALPEQAPITLNSAAKLELLGRQWPGNVRELSNLVERLSIRYPAAQITLEMLPPASRRSVSSAIGAYAPSMAPLDPPRGVDFSHAEDPAMTNEEQAALWGDASNTVTDINLALAHSADLESGVNLKDHLRDIEVTFIEQALQMDSGNVTKAAKRLGLGRTTLIEKIRKHAIEYQDGAAATA